MKPKTSRQILAQIHAALGHARRLKLLEILARTPQGLTFEDLSHQSRINPSTLGFHVKVLDQAGFLHKTIKGPYSIYQYDPSPLNMILLKPPLKAAA